LASDSHREGLQESIKVWGWAANLFFHPPSLHCLGALFARVVRRGAAILKRFGGYTQTN